MAELRSVDDELVALVLDATSVEDGVLVALAAVEDEDEDEDEADEVGVVDEDGGEAEEIADEVTELMTLVGDVWDVVDTDVDSLLLETEVEETDVTDDSEVCPRVEVGSEGTAGVFVDPADEMGEPATGSFKSSSRSCCAFTRLPSSERDEP